MQSRGEDAALLEDTGWTLDLAFLTDITGKRNSLNWELQGKAHQRGEGGPPRRSPDRFYTWTRQAANPSRWATGEQVNMLGRLETLGTPPAADASMAQRGTQQLKQESSMETWREEVQQLREALAEKEEQLSRVVKRRQMRTVAHVEALTLLNSTQAVVL
ncbi:hypothetical protein D4764_02G0001150 [Takifugu flavidus]|uniref:Uncharacterized protein n=1 Tax=Takifugu flavidus TaxID=433684 RepID=A0A5C6NHT9_9TELE|nr:hypothetical protein D4764_02G0001150 [Takifugu flavidus]